MNVTKKTIKNEIKDLKSLIKAYKIVEHDLNEIDIKISLMNLIYRKSLNLIQLSIDYLKGKNSLTEVFMNDIINYENDINNYVNVFSVEKTYHYIIGYLNL